MAEVTRAEAVRQVRRTIGTYRDRVHEARNDTRFLPPEGARIVNEYCSFENDWQELVQDAIRETSFFDMMDDGLLLEYCAVCMELDGALELGSWRIGRIDSIIKDDKGHEYQSIERTPYGNNPIKYTTSDGRKNSYYPQHFDAENYVKHQLTAMGAGFYIAFRQAKSYIGNFFANLFTGKGDIGIVTSGSVQIGDISYGCTITGTVKKGFSIEFDNLKLMGLTTLQSAFSNSPITLNVDGLYVQYKIVKLTVSVNSSDASFKLELTTGKKLKAGNMSAGVIVSAPYSEGPCATIENRKSGSLNDAVDYYQYVNSLEFYLDNWGY